MAKTKWIVPAVALVLCAASLIGAGYAAYTATLTDNETVTADNNFVTLTLGSSPLTNVIDIYYDYDIVYNNGVEVSRAYVPYLDVNLTPAVTKHLGAFTVTGTDTYKGDEVSVNGYTLAVSALSVTEGTPSTFSGTIKIFSDNLYSAEVTGDDLETMEFGQTYYVALYYNQTGDLDKVTSGTPSESLTITYTFTATANIANA